MADKDKEEFMHDWYAILGCDQTSTKEAIEKAARKLAMKYHPDKTTDPEAPEKFLLVQKAKEILLDETKRKVIDDHREASAKREAYEKHKNLTMDARRKRMRDDFNDRLQKATANQHIPTEAEVFQNELRKRSKIIDDLRKKNSNLMEQSRDEAISKESQQAKDFLNYRKTATETGAGGCCQLKVKWKRSAESHSEESLYRMFKAFGTVEDAVLVAGKGTSGLVTFTDAASAMKAYDFYRNSEEYRVSLLSADGTNASAPPLRTTATPQSELASDIRRAMEKSNLIDVINQLKRPSTDNLAASAGVETTTATGGTAAAGAQTTSVPPAKPAVTAASLASKESDILQRMMEAAAKKKQAALDAQSNGTANVTAP
jgi:curved DNA-binding protein CbpA